MQWRQRVQCLARTRACTSHVTPLRCWLRRVAEISELSRRDDADTYFVLCILAYLAVSKAIRCGKNQLVYTHAAQLDVTLLSAWSAEAANLRRGSDCKALTDAAVVLTEAQIASGSVAPVQLSLFASMHALSALQSVSCFFLLLLQTLDCILQGPSVERWLHDVVERGCAVLANVPGCQRLPL